MKQTDEIKQMIDNANEENLLKWDLFIKDVRCNFGPEIVGSLDFSEVNMNVPMPKYYEWVTGLVKIMIDDVAPIYLVFSKIESKAIDHYLVPAINRLDFTWTTSRIKELWFPGTEVLRVDDLSMALAMASKVYEFKTQNSISYVPLKDCVPGLIEACINADQRVLTGLRAIIREEIHRMACED